MRAVISLWRSLRLTEHLLTGATIALFLATGRAFGYRAGWTPDVVCWWHRRLCRALGLSITTTGDLATGALLVANHVSWLDIPVLGAQGKISFLSKAEVRNWPLVGWMAEIAGTLFIARGANQAGDMIGRIRARIRTGERVVVFPEGTTTDGTRLQRFHPRLFAAGQAPGLSIQPVALRYGRDSAPDLLAPFVGDDSLVPHLIRLIRHPGLEVQIRFLPPIEEAELDRRGLSGRCREAIARALGIGSAAPTPPQEAEEADVRLQPGASLGECV